MTENGFYVIYGPTVRTEALPNPSRTAEIWRAAAARAGVGDLYLVRV